MRIKYMNPEIVEMFKLWLRRSMQLFTHNADCLCYGFARDCKRILDSNLTDPDTDLYFSSFLNDMIYKMDEGI